MLIDSKQSNKSIKLPIADSHDTIIKDNIITVKDIVKKYKNGSTTQVALGPVSFHVQRGEFLGVYGRSGSGKSTLMNLLTSLDKPTSGEIIVNQLYINKIKGGDMKRYRGSIGIIFQSYNLLANLNVLQNVMVGSWASDRVENLPYARELLKKLGIEKLEKKNIKFLSGGEKQRVAIARALINKPSIIFCDEPTGALDSSNEDQVIDILKKLNEEGMTIVMITHNPDLEKIVDRVITLKDGQII
jgi:putative ABC transport system ATP-binding protein